MSKGLPFSASTLNLSLCYQASRKDQYLDHSCSSKYKVDPLSSQFYPWHQQRAKKNHFVSAVSVRTKQRLWKNEPLPFCYWHEFLDLVCVFRWIVSLSDSFISVIYPHALDPGALTPLKVLRGIRLEPLRTVFTGRLPRTWNTLSAHLQNLRGCLRKNR